MPAPAERGGTTSVDRGPDDLPVLVAVRGWSAADDPSMPALLERLERDGMAVLDVFVAPEPFATMAEWSAAVRAEIDASVPAGEPLHLLGYCLGGHVLLELLGQVSPPGRPGAGGAGSRPVEYAGLVDCWYRPGRQWVERGIYGRYGVGWWRRSSHQLLRLGPPDPERLVAVVASWVRRGSRSAGRSLRRGRMVDRRPAIANWTGQHLAYDWFYPRVATPVHLYNASETVLDMDGDPSLGLSPYLVGGFTTTVLEGCDHRTCLQAPVSDRLVSLIAGDRRSAASG